MPRARSYAGRPSEAAGNGARRTPVRSARSRRSIRSWPGGQGGPAGELAVRFDMARRRGCSGFAPPTPRSRRGLSAPRMSTSGPRCGRAIPSTRRSRGPALKASREPVLHDRRARSEGLATHCSAQGRSDRVPRPGGLARGPLQTRRARAPPLVTRGAPARQGCPRGSEWPRRVARAPPTVATRRSSLRSRMEPERATSPVGIPRATAAARPVPSTPCAFSRA